MPPKKKPKLKPKAVPKKTTKKPVVKTIAKKSSVKTTKTVKKVVKPVAKPQAVPAPVKKPKKRKTHIIVMSLVSLVALVGIAAYQTFTQDVYDSSADTATTSATIQNELPSVSSVQVDSGAANVTLTENTTTDVVCTATVTDNNNCEEIQDGTAVFYRTNAVGGAGCSGDDNDCYTGVTCSVDGGSCTGGGGDTTATYTCTVAVQYFADPTDTGSANEASDWTCTITPIDSTGPGTPGSDIIEMNSLTALNVTGAVDYGSLALGASTSSNQTTTVTNSGNEAIDAQVSGTEMTCTSGTVEVAKQKYDISDAAYAVLTNSLSGTPATLELDLAQQTGAAVTDLVYWGLELPATGASGTCAGTNTFTAISD